MEISNAITSFGGVVLALLIVGGLVQGKAIALPVGTPLLKRESISPHQRLWVVTGGQTGVDRAALDTALSLLLPVRGWCPKGRLAEDGKIPSVYPLQETTSTDYALRTADLAHKYDRPVLIINALSFNDQDAARFWSWIQKHNIRILNVAGPRESSQPGVIYNRARYVLKQLLES
jgi:hypothetical protein